MSTEGTDPSASGSHSGAEPDPLIGQVLDGRYRILDQLGEGGMGQVYAAEHVHIEKRVAIKLLRSEILTNEEAVKRFRQEARSASSIGHQNIIGIEDFGTISDGRIYLAMELLDGAPLNDLIHGQQLTPDRLLDILIQTCHGLAAAHKKGIVHRDMKPENIFVTHGDVPKLLDFGIAKVSGADGNNHLTRTGTIFGTPFYMAPEQALGQEVDHRADVYAMGVIAYEVFCGAVPFQGESFMGILTQHITAEPMAPAQMAAEHGKPLPPGAEEVILRAMKKDPAERYQTMDALVEALVALRRSVAGPGMSSYMEAHRPPPRSATIAAMGAPPPSPAQRGPSTSTPAPYQGQHHGQPQPFAATEQSGLYGAPPSETFEVPRRSKAGLIAAIVCVLAVVGGGVGFFVLSQQKDAAAGETTSAEPEPAAVEDEPDETIDPEADGEPDEVAADGVLDGVEEPAADDEPVDPMPPETVLVLIGSKPQGADVYVAGKKLAEPTPVMVQVVKGELTEVVLRKRRHEELTLTLDGSEERLTPSLERVRARSGGGKSGGSKTGDGKSGGSKTGDGKSGDGKSGDGKSGDGKSGDGKSGDGKSEPVDPCKKNPNLPDCWLE